MPYFRAIASPAAGISRRPFPGRKKTSNSTPLRCRLDARTMACRPGLHWSFVELPTLIQSGCYPTMYFYFPVGELRYRPHPPSAARGIAECRATVDKAGRLPRCRPGSRPLRRALHSFEPRRPNHCRRAGAHLTCPDLHRPDPGGAAGKRRTTDAMGLGRAKTL